MVCEKQVNAYGIHDIIVDSFFRKICKIINENSLSFLLKSNYLVV